MCWGVTIGSLADQIVVRWMGYCRPGRAFLVAGETPDLNSPGTVRQHAGGLCGRSRRMTRPAACPWRYCATPRESTQTDPLA